MGRIKIEDLAKSLNISKEELKQVLGGVMSDDRKMAPTLSPGARAVGAGDPGDAFQTIEVPADELEVIYFFSPEEITK